ncbi:hypothetical protein BKI52_16065 [marine bacterium AO1-C]|nr:hypothetical protein BKI52_16065 [marine bacterium AO1-C]
MKETEGNEHIDFFSQDTILDYIDGRLSTQDNALFEQQMQEDEMLQLAVEGIKGFYTEEQKDRPYLETLMTQSEENLKQALVEVENAPKVVALNARRNRKIIGISIAACVALLMVFSLPGLLDNGKATPSKEEIAVTTTNPEKTTQKTPEPKVADAKEQGENAAQTGPKRDEVTTSGNPDMLNRTDAIAFEEKKIGKTGPENKNTDGGVVTETETLELEEDMPPPVNQGFIPLPKKADEQTKDASHSMSKKPGNINEKKANLESEKALGDFSAKKKAEKSISQRSKKSAKGRPRRRTARKESVNVPPPNSTYLSADKKKGTSATYRAPGKLHLWVYTDQQNMEYFRVQSLGREIADNTGLELVLTKANTQVFLNQKWKRHIKKQKLGANDVVWVYYLGKNIPTTTINKYNKQSAGNRVASQLNSSVNDLSRRLERSKVALKIVTVDNGNQSQPALDDFTGGQTNNSNTTPYTQQGITQVGKSLPKKNEVYKKLFLGSSGIITILNSEPGRNVYQGIFTDNLVQSLQSAYWSNDPNVDWGKILNKTTTLTQRRSQKLGKPQEIQQRKMKVKKSY